MVTGPILSAVQRGVQSFGNPVEDFSISGGSSMWMIQNQSFKCRNQGNKKRNSNSPFIICVGARDTPIIIAFYYKYHSIYSLAASGTFKVLLTIAAEHFD
uniref:Cytosolic purine 5-nucleotidase n=1 Tax=Rhizophora mucronata TaxID=61149 RepID=A0A2P2K093_RHIMU